MKTKLPEEITSVKEIENLFNELAKNGELYHIEDDAHDIIFSKTEQRMFTDEEADKLESLVTQCYALVEDPCEYAYNAFVKYMQPI